MTELIDQLLNVVYFSNNFLLFCIWWQWYIHKKVVENQLEKQRHSEDEIASKCEESRKEIQKFETLLEKASFIVIYDTETRDSLMKFSKEQSGRFCKFIK